MTVQSKLHRVFPVATLVLVGFAWVFPIRAPGQPPADSSESLQRSFQDTVLPFLEDHCFGCHGEQTPEAKLDLTSYRSLSEVTEGFQTWESVVARLEAGEMPPQDAGDTVDPSRRDSVIRWYQAVREAEAQRTAGDPGEVLARRLSNAEYNYTIRDLTGVDIRPTATFPVDPANEAGFDNSGESLSMSPALLNKYLGAARFVAEHLLLTPQGIAFAPHPVVTNTDRDKYCVKRIVSFYQRQPTDYADYLYTAWQFRNRDQWHRDSESLDDFATRAGISGKYLATIWDLLHDHQSEIHQSDHQPLDVGPIALLRARWKSLPDDPDRSAEVRNACEQLRDIIVELRQRLTFDFPNLRIEGGNPGSQPFVLWKNRQYVEHRRKCNLDALRIESEPETASTPSADPTPPQPLNEISIDEVLVLPADETQRKRAVASFERFCSVFPDALYVSERGRDYVDANQKQDGEKGRLLSAGFHSMMGYFRDDQPLYDLVLDRQGQEEIDRLWQELDFITSAPMRQYAGFLWFDRTDSRFMRDPQFDFARAEDKSATSDAMIRRLAEVYLEKARLSGGGSRELEAIDHFFREINAQVRWVENARIAAEPAQLDALLQFAERAYRRPLPDSEREGLLAFYRSLREIDGLSHDEAMEDLLVSVLMSPYFCYRLDLATSGEAIEPLDDEELASRLSYFLWSSTPDQELTALARSKKLSQTEVLLAQTRRMLGDQRVRGLATEFGGNWLDFRRFEEHNSVDRVKFPQFDEDLRQAMFEEPIRFLMDVIQRDRPVVDLLHARDTFVNASLARHYGFPVDSAETGWVHVEDADSRGRGGLLPMSVFLTKNAPGLRTSPVKRGYWVVRRLLGERIPPPPPNVPELPNNEADLGDLTLREALARHREHASCAGCHERFDSIGLAFEGYGPIGELRELDLGGRPVDTTASFPSGDEGSGIEGLKRYLQDHRQSDFNENLCRKLLAFALGRSLQLSDEVLVKQMQSKLQNGDGGFHTLVECIVTSPQFLNKRGQAQVAATSTTGKPALAN